MTRLLLALVAACAAVLGAVPAASATGTTALTAPDPNQPAVVVLGAPGLSLRDLSPQETPTLWSLATKGATADLVVRGGYLQTCGVDGWLSLGAGGRVAFPRPGSPDLTDPEAAPVCPEVGLTGTGAVEGWGDAVDLVRERKTDATLGVLADSLRAAGTCVEASGGAGASIAAADGRGEVGDGSGGCAVRLVDVGQVDGERDAARQAQVRDVDTAVQEAVSGLPEETLVVVAGLGDSGTGPALRALVYSGGGDPRSAAGVEPGALSSPTTRRTGVVQLPDLTADLLERVGAEPVAPLAGRPLSLVRDDRGGAAERLADQADVAGQLEVADASIPPFFRGLAAVVVVASVLGALAWALLRRRPARRPLVHVLRTAALVLASVPAATYAATLAPWWSGDHPVLALAGWTALGAGLLTALALAVTAGSTRRGLTAVGVVGGVTALLLTADLLLRDGASILLGVLGLHPWDGGRFYGFGNVPFALFVTGALLAVTALLDPLLRAGRRRAATALAAVLGLVLLVLVAAPFVGADGGGTLAVVPAVGYLVLAVSGARVTLLRLLLIGVVTVGGFLAVAGLDYLRPEDERSHLGRFFGRVLTGDAWEVVERKLVMNLEMLLGPERAALLVPVGLVLVVWALARPGSRLARPLAGPLEEHPALRPGLVALVVALTAGFLLNDSGTGIPAVASIILVPSLVVLALPAGPDAGRAATRSP